MGLLDFLFGSSKDEDFDIEDYRSIHENRRHIVEGSSNWTDQEDWDCDSEFENDEEHDYMDGFDIYEDNDF